MDNRDTQNQNSQSKKSIKNKDNKEVGFQYQDFIYQIEKELTVEDSKYLMDYNLKGYRFYVIHNLTNHFRILFFTNEKLKIDTQIDGRELFFRKINNALHKDDTKVYIIEKINEFGNKYIDVSESPVEDSSNPIYTYWLHYTETFDPNNNEIKLRKIHKKNMHETRIAVKRNMWYKEELLNLNIKDIPKKIQKDIYNKAIVDSRITKLLKTEFFTIDQYRDEEKGKSQEYMMHNSHAIGLTQGSTGKSSILCSLGNDLHTTTDAGMFGYMDVTAGSWRAGEVSKTKDAIIVDEINEIIKQTAKKGETVLDILNTPLENGRYSYGKAGGMKLSFGNQFIFLGNISDEFHFENFVNGLAGNQSTLGRRFAYIIYDDKLVFKNGDYRDIVKHIRKIKPLKAFLSDILLFYLKKKKFQDKKVRQNKLVLNMIEKHKKQFKNLIHGMEHPNTKLFFDAYVSHSLENRLPLMALKLTIFDNANMYLEEKNFYEIDNRVFWRQFYKNLENLFKDIEVMLQNVISHQEVGTIADESSNKLANKILSLNKSQRLLMVSICDNISKFDGIRLNYEDIENKTLLKDIRNKIVNKNQTKHYDELTNFGIHYKKENKDLYFLITNKFKFQQTHQIVSEHRKELVKDLSEKIQLNTTPQKVPKLAEEKAEEKKEQIEKAWNKESPKVEEKKEVEITKKDEWDEIDMSDLS